MKLILTRSIVTRTATALASAMSALLLTSCATAPGAVSTRSAADPASAPDRRSTARATLTGMLSCGDEVALPDDGTLRITLEDMTPAVPTPALAVAVLSGAAARIPLRYALTFDADDLDPDHRYGVSARIDQAGRVLVAGTRIDLDPAAFPSSVDLVLAPAR